MRLVYSTSNFLLRGVLRTFARWEVVGRENVPPMGPLIVVANHLSNMDPPLLAASLPRRLHYLAKEGMFVNPAVAWFFRSYGAFPLNREGVDISAMRWALSVLDQDKALVIFPEGTRSPGGIRKPLPGIAHLALKSGAPILPVGITGTERIGPIWRVVLPTGHIRVKIGQIFTIPSLEGPVKRPQLEALTDMIMQRVVALLPESYHGVYRTRSEKPKEADRFRETG